MIFFSTLQKMYPDATTELHYETPFQLLMAVMLSAQTTDRQVNKVTDNLFLSIKNPQDIITLGLTTLEESLNRINYYRNKAKHLFQTAQTLTSESFLEEMKTMCTQTRAHDIYQQEGYYIPDTETQLRRLPGVGIKTANVILNTLYDLPVIAVDTHVHRVANRIGLVSTKTPEQTAKILLDCIPTKYRHDAHHTMILFGRYYCKAIKPKCDHCPFTKICKFYDREH